jgi:hypothetical protein
MSCCMPLTGRARALLFSLALSSSSAYALDAPGRIHFITGEAAIVDRAQQSRPAQKGAALNAGDTVVTQDGRVQIRFSDGGHFSLQPHTQFRLDEYRYTGNDDQGDHVFLSLIKGGLRTISGLIGKHNRPAYRLSTTVATIGIRGTEYALDLNATLYGHVTRGAIEVCNGAGCLSVPGGKAFFAASPTLRPVLTPKRAMLAPPDRVIAAAAAPVHADEASGQTGLTSGTGDAVATTSPKSYAADAAATDFVLKDPKAALAVSAAGTAAAGTSNASVAGANNAATASGATSTQNNSAQAATPAGNSAALATAGNQQVAQLGNQPGASANGAQTGNAPGLGQSGQVGNQQSAAGAANPSVSGATGNVLSTATQVLAGKVKKPKKVKGG